MGRKRNPRIIDTNFSETCIQSGQATSISGVENESASLEGYEKGQVCCNDGTSDQVVEKVNSELAASTRFSKNAGERDFFSPPPHKRKLNAKQQIKSFRKDLPIYAERERILNEIDVNQSVIVIGETGSGKTTQLVQYIYERYGHSRGDIVITQPRRLATKTTAARVAEEMGVELGSLVGYNVRFENKTTAQTHIRFLTDGMAVRECMINKKFAKYGFVILDEAHERSIYTDILCALVREIQKKNSNLKVIVMSATLEAQLFEKYFEAKVLYVKGRQYPVQVFYLEKPESNWIEALIITVLQIHLEEEAVGDILAFLTGREEIESAARILEQKAKLVPPSAAKLIVRTLYSAQSNEQQKKAFDPAPQNCRKVILATNVAETSLTVPGVKFIVDSGLVKQRQRITRSELEKDSETKLGGSQIDILTVVVESKAQAWQRAGRAGRTQPGKAYRLFTEAFFLEKMRDSQVPEIKRVDLTYLLLQLFTIGISDPLSFPFIEPPSKASLSHALMALIQHGAISRERKITELGKKMSIFPVEPRYSKVLICSQKFECTQQIMNIIAMLNVDNIFLIPSKDTLQPIEDSVSNFELQAQTTDNAKKVFASEIGDHISLLNLYYAYLQEDSSNRKKWSKKYLINWRAMEKSISIKKQLVQYWKDRNWHLGQESATDIQFMHPNKEQENLIERICKCFILGFFENIAIKRENGTYETIKEQKRVLIHPSSTMANTRPECILYNELVYTSNFYVRDVLTIQRNWLEELVPEYVLNKIPQSI
ncbi:putative pre-mRNA-splicing factor ATP-dependent RNA helicase PRP1 [Schistocerca gregaria]|uniref:putative pre-mRNA-splicing factor ATP-dependent RNA helicase PRP1 n=1 Tax=Schistocerca gregaria TaxID=7010 RepID=UPI00211F2D8D|nr:putative pre-mRNA-splicing factor ATP-dependent RNA helicase PRP1 [Schistocerca gregaria]